MGATLKNNPAFDAGSSVASNDATKNFLLDFEGNPEAFTSNWYSPFSNDTDGFYFKDLVRVSHSADRVLTPNNDVRKFINLILDGALPGELQDALFATTEPQIAQTVPFHNKSEDTAISEESFYIQLERVTSPSDFMGDNSATTGVQNVDSHNGDTYLNLGCINIVVPRPVTGDEFLITHSILSESPEAKPVGETPNGFLHMRLKDQWEKADKLRQQVDLNPENKKLLKDWQKTCLKWSERNREFCLVPQVHLKPKSGKVKKSGKPPMPKTLKCPFCETWTQTFSTLKRHLNLELKDYKPFVCKVCQVRCSRADGLKSHSKVHQDKK